MAVDTLGAGVVRRLARAKINLALHVTGRRADGYHLLDSLVAFSGVGDVVSVEPAESLTLAITGPMGAGLSAGRDNLVLKAALTMGRGRGAAITLDKHLPVASGMGGGSADAAATLHALSQVWGCDLPTPEAVLRLGADVPVCLAGQPARMAGIGEYITPCVLPPAHVVLANPGLALGTATVFAALTAYCNPGLPEAGAFADAAALGHYLRQCRNDLEAPALGLAPVIGTVIAALLAQTGCLLARMSGSGATCFGLFATAPEADQAAAILGAAHPGWWVRSAPLEA